MNTQKMKNIGDALTISFVLALFAIIPLIFILSLNSIVISIMLLPIILGILGTKIAFSLIDTRDERKGDDNIPQELHHEVVQSITTM
ncbi:MAG: hypothetical protein ACTSUE_14170 [Promethearchaeota archaeon]